MRLGLRINERWQLLLVALAHFFGAGHGSCFAELESSRVSDWRDSMTRVMHRSRMLLLVRVRGGLWQLSLRGNISSWMWGFLSFDKCDCWV